MGWVRMQRDMPKTAVEMSVLAWSIPPCCLSIHLSQCSALPTATISSSAEVSWETSCVLATAYFSGHCRAALAPSIFHCPNAHLNGCSIVSVNLNSACTFSLLSLEIHVLAHPLEQLRPSMKGSMALLCSATVPRDSWQQTQPCRFPYSWVSINCSIHPFAKHWSPPAADCV